MANLFGDPMQTQEKLFNEPIAPAQDFEPFKASGELARALAAKGKASQQEPKRSTWPPPWHKSTPADKRIARQYRADGTDEFTFPEGSK